MLSISSSILVARDVPTILLLSWTGIQDLKDRPSIVVSEKVNVNVVLVLLILYCRIWELVHTHEQRGMLNAVDVLGGF